MAPTPNDQSNPADQKGVPIVDKVFEDEAKANAGFRFDVLIIILLILAFAYIAWFLVTKYMRSKQHSQVPQDENEADEEADKAGEAEQLEDQQ